MNYVPDYYLEFHEYAVEWTATCVDVTYYVDSKPYRSFTNATQLPVNPHRGWRLARGAQFKHGVPSVYHYIDLVRVSQKIPANIKCHHALLDAGCPRAINERNVVKYGFISTSISLQTPSSIGFNAILQFALQLWYCTVLAGPLLITPVIIGCNQHA